MKQFHIEKGIYAAIADKLTDAIGEGSYFSGDIDHEDDYGNEYHLGITVMVYRRTVTAPDCSWNEIYNIVPLWWEFHTYVGDDKEEVWNDFMFEEFKRWIVS